MRIDTTIDIDTEELANSLPHDSLLKFIRDLDEDVGDWEFTLKLITHFKNLEKKYQQINDPKVYEDGDCENCAGLAFDIS